VWATNIKKIIPPPPSVMDIIVPLYASVLWITNGTVPPNVYHATTLNNCKNSIKVNEVHILLCCLKGPVMHILE
jgi:hypothetical protein